MRLTNSKDVNTYLNSLFEIGWKYTSFGKHIKLFPSNNSSRFVLISKTPSDRRALLNIKQSVRKVSCCYA